MRNVVRSSEVTLLETAPRARGVYETTAENGRTLDCDVMSVGMRETYEAMSHDHHPEYALDIGHWENYQDEDTCLFEGRRYYILRHRIDSNLHMILTIERERQP